MAFLTDDQIDFFDEHGYLLIEGLLDPINDLDPVIKEYHHVLDNLATMLYENGEIESRYEDLPFDERLVQIYRESETVHAQFFDFSLPKGAVALDTPMWVGPAVFHLLSHKRLLDVVESLIGPEIYSNPVQHVRLKPPERLTPINPETGQVQLGATPWHQDNGVVLPEADETEMITVWFPLWDAPVESGCLEIVPDSHRDGLQLHCPAAIGTSLTNQYVQAQQNRLAMPMKRGDVLLLHKHTAHSSLSNNSDSVRWSFDLRYNPIGQPTGREAFPGFVARSHQDPASELRDPEGWAELWYEARRNLAALTEPAIFDRWSADHPSCA